MKSWDADTLEDYVNNSPRCYYYDWSVRAGGDDGSSKTLWDWIGADQGYNCGDADADAMANDYAGSTYALRLTVRCHL